MKRLHVHTYVTDLDATIRFYETLFDAAPSVRRDDYAKWLLDDPAVNFAVSLADGRDAGIDHLGFQVDSDEELKAVRARLSAAERAIVEETDASCCYAKSDKVWSADPTGVFWETFHTTGESDVLHAADGVKQALGDLRDGNKAAPATNTCC